MEMEIQQMHHLKKMDPPFVEEHNIEQFELK